MKRCVCLLLILCLFLSGCSGITEPVNFYYVRKNYQNDMQQVIASEVREAAGHKDDLVYLLALYSMGPVTDDLQSPMPINAVIVPTERSSDGLTLTLSESGQSMTDVDFTLSSACIAMTCMDLLDVLKVTVVCGDRTVTIDKDNLLLDSNLITNFKEETK